MSHLALALVATLAMPPGTGGDRMTAGHASMASMAARPLPDDGLKPGTVSVLVRKGKAGLEAAEVWMLPSSSAGDDRPATDTALANGVTNSEGRIFLDGSGHMGRDVVIWVKLGGSYKKSVPFTVPVQGGVRLLFLAGGGSPHGAGSPPSSPRANPHSGHAMGSSLPKGPVTNDPAHLRLWISFRVMAIENGKIYLALTYSVINRGKETFHGGEHGLLLPTPIGAKGISLPRSTRGSKVEKGRLITYRPVPPGRHGLRVQVSCNLPYKRPTRQVHLSSHLPIIGYSVSMKKYRTVRMAGPGLGEPESFSGGDSGTDWLVYRSGSQGELRDEIRFNVTHLPVRSRAGAWLFGGLSLLLVAFAFGATVVRRGKREKAGDTDLSVEDRLVRIGRDRTLGLIDQEEARRRAEKCLGAERSAGDQDEG